MKLDTITESSFLIYNFFIMTVRDTEQGNSQAAESQDSQATEHDTEGQDSNNGDANAGNTEQDQDKSQDNAKQSAMGAIKSRQAKIDAGEITKEECPLWMQEDLRDKKEDVQPSKEDLTATIKAQLRDEDEFEKIQKSLPEDLDEETAESINTIVEREMGFGKTSSQALKYAAYECGIQLAREKSQEQKMAEVHRFPRITPRKTTPKSSEIENYYDSTLPDEYKK